MEGVAQCEINHDPERHDDYVICPAGGRGRRSKIAAALGGDASINAPSQKGPEEQGRAEITIGKQMCQRPSLHPCEHWMLKAGLDVARDKRSDNEDHRK